MQQKERIVIVQNKGRIFTTDVWMDKASDDRRRRRRRRHKTPSLISGREGKKMSKFLS